MVLPPDFGQPPHWVTDPEHPEGKGEPMIRLNGGFATATLRNITTLLQNTLVFTPLRNDPLRLAL